MCRYQIFEIDTLSDTICKNIVIFMRRVANQTSFETKRTAIWKDEVSSYCGDQIQISEKDFFTDIFSVCTFIAYIEIFDIETSDRCDIDISICR